MLAKYFALVVLASAAQQTENQQLLVVVLWCHAKYILVCIELREGVCVGGVSVSGSDTECVSPSSDNKKPRGYYTHNTPT